MAELIEVSVSLPTTPDEIASRSVNCHLVPCEIKYRGPSAVDKLFPLDPSDESTASFRGRQLKGKEIIPPKGYKSVILNEEDGTMKTYCGKMVYWNWDKNPSPNDSVSKMMDWFKISEAIHGRED